MWLDMNIVYHVYKLIDDVVQAVANEHFLVYFTHPYDLNKIKYNLVNLLNKFTDLLNYNALCIEKS